MNEPYILPPLIRELRNQAVAQGKCVSYLIQRTGENPGIIETSIQWMSPACTSVMEEPK